MFSANSIFFIIFSSIILIGSIATIASKNMIYTLLFATSVFLAVSGLFFLLGAKYNAVVQLLVYVVIIPILIAVSVMLTNTKTNTKSILKNKIIPLLGVLLFTLLLVEFVTLNSDIFEIIKSCFVYINQYSDFESIYHNLTKNYSLLLFEFGIGVIITITGLCYYEK